MPGVRRKRSHKEEVRVHYSLLGKGDKSGFHPLFVATHSGFGRAEVSGRKSDWRLLNKHLRANRATRDGHHYRKPGEKKRRKLNRGEITTISQRLLRRGK